MAEIRVSVTRIGDSCGYAVPLMTFTGDRDVLDKWAESKGPEGLQKYRRDKNLHSIDGNEGYKEQPPPIRH